MKACELFLKNGESPIAFSCEKCGRLGTYKDDIERCCSLNICACGAACELYYTSCKKCVNKLEENKEQKRFENAEKTTSWDGWVYCQGVGSEYYSSLEEFLDVAGELEGEGEDSEGILGKINYVWTCTPNQVVKIDIEDIKSLVADNSDTWDGFDPNNLDGLEELDRALQMFRETNKNVLSYYPNYKKVLVLSK